MVCRSKRVHVIPQVLTKASSLGVQNPPGESLSKTLKIMVKYSLPYTREKRDKAMRSYGAFKLVVRGNRLIDIMLQTDQWCPYCFDFIDNHDENNFCVLSFPEC
jgi:hypothetical protein